MGDLLKHATHWTAVRGNCFSRQMPYEQILQSLIDTKSKLNLATDLADLPLAPGEEIVAELLRRKIVVGAPDICKHVLQVTPRPYEVCALLDVLLASGHPAFGSRGNRAQWRAKLHAAVAAKYPKPLAQELFARCGLCRCPGILLGAPLPGTRWRRLADSSAGESVLDRERRRSHYICSKPCELSSTTMNPQMQESWAM